MSSRKPHFYLSLSKSHPLWESPTKKGDKMLSSGDHCLPCCRPPQFKSLPQAFHLFAQTQLLAGTSSLPAYKLYNLSALVPTGCVTSLTLISGFGELTLVLLCSNNPVLLLFQFDFICLTVPMRKPVIRLQKTF